MLYIAARKVVLTSISGVTQLHTMNRYEMEVSHEEIISETLESQNGCPCMFCGKTYRDKNILKRHQTLVHIADVSIPKFVCPYENCKKVFVNKQKYSGHMNKHEGKMPYSCSKCLAMFYDKYKKNDHEQVCFNIVTHNCGECGRSFTDKWSLNRHKESLHGGKLFPCIICGKVYTFYSSLHKHKKNRHPHLS